MVGARVRCRSTRSAVSANGTVMTTRQNRTDELSSLAKAAAAAGRNALLRLLCAGLFDSRRGLANTASGGGTGHGGDATVDSPTQTEDTGNPRDTKTTEGRLANGSVLNGRFVIIRFIAKGGMGEVYEAEDRFLQGTHIALKTIL